jgi:hypothetical protein
MLFGSFSFAGTVVLAVSVSNLSFVGPVTFATILKEWPERLAPASVGIYNANINIVGMSKLTL